MRKWQLCALLMVLACSSSEQAMNDQLQPKLPLSSLVKKEPNVWEVVTRDPGHCPWIGTEHPLADMRAMPPYTTPADKQCAGASRCEWEPFLRGSAVVIRTLAPHDSAFPLDVHYQPPDPFLDGRVVSQRVSDGWLIGIDKQDHGGQLFWVRDGGKHGAHLADERVRGFAAFGDVVLVAIETERPYDEGYSPFGAGKVMKVKRNALDVWEARELAALPARPYAVGRVTEGLLVAHAQGLMLVFHDGRTLDVLEADWSAVRPSTLLPLDDGSVLLGGHHAVIQLARTAQGYEQSWLVPRPCTEIYWEQATSQCHCTGT